MNRAPTVYPRDGTVAIPDRATFELLSYKGRTVPFHGYLRDLEFLKFYISRVNSSRPMVYFINTNTHTLHPDFWRAVHGFGSQHSSSLLAGELVFHPNAVAPDGSLGVYRFEYKSWNGYRFEQISMINDALAASMPLLENNLAYHPRTEEMQRAYRQEQALFDASRVNVLLAEEILPDVPFLPLNVGQGYGFLRVMSLEERPDPRDVVIYETLPNELSRVAGIITTVPQTPLSHVNLRAVQDGVPNAFIRNALDGGDNGDNGDGGHIDDLIGRYVYYAVGAGGYSIRAATRAEVDAHFASSRPSETQTPERDLTVTDIAPLSDLGFDDWNAFGVKAANVAVLRTLGFPEGTVPEGFAVPFYFYDEFMKHNGFYSDVEELLADPEFRSDFDTQEQELKKLRKKIKKGETPDWIIDALEDMHASYPEGQSLRYRSSTNNEDLPGFSGAGLYDSKTQDPEETAADGIDKSLKGVWASLWNFRAFVERDTHGVDHLATAMGVLVHPNYSGELANGVAVSFDPIHSTEGSYYVNTQLGEDLVTNPDANSVPEEILLDSSGSYTTLAASNQVAHGQLLMSDAQIDQLRQHLQVIHDHFEGLYNPEPGEAFAMEIEFKITSDDILSIKQARPWVFSVPNSAATGAPTISGTAQLGETLTASTSNIADADGLTNATFLYQWSRNDGNDGNDGADIEGAAEPSYTPSVSDVGKTIRVRASFTDDANNAETLTSAATEVVQPGGNAWSTTMTVGTRDGYTGYSHWGDPDLGSLSETAVEWDGKTHYVRYLFLKDGELWLGLNEEMLSTGFALSAGDEEFGSADAMVDHGGASYRFRWDDPGLGWSDGAEVTVNLVQSDQNTPALGAPIISGTAQVAETLTADTSGVEDADGLTNVSYSYQWLAGGSDIGGATGSSYTLTASEQGQTIKVKVAFTDDSGNSESLASTATVAVVAAPNSPATGAPTITGTPQVGETLAADTSAIADADGMTGASFVYSWNAGERHIQGATGVSYTLAQDQEGETMQVLVAFLDDQGNSEVLASEASDPVAAAPNSPATGLPAISGTPQVGETLTVSTSDIADQDGLTNVSYSYQWIRSDNGADTDIAGATDSTYTPSPGDVGKTIQVKVTFSDDEGNNESLTGAATKAVAATAPTAPQSLSVVTGDQDQELEASWQAPSSNGGSAVTGYRVQWKKAADSWDTEADVSEAAETGTTYTITDLTGGVEYAVRVIATNDVGDGPASAEAKGTPAGGASEQVVEPENSAPTGLPGITGTPQVDETLTADTSTIDDEDGLTNVAWEYQWIAGGTDIDGATGSIYTLTASQQGQTVQVRVTFTDDADNEETLTSAATVAVTAAPNREATGQPTISGTLQVGETLTADTSPIDDGDGLTNVSYEYQWIAGGTDIDGATGSGYTLTASEQGKTIQVRVTFTDDADNRESLTSVATVAVAAKPVPLTASFSNAPASHDGSAEFTFDLAFSENFPLSYITLRDHAFTADGGDVKRAQRKVPGSNRTWTITVEPDGNGDVSITLPETTDCDDEGAICTFDKRKLSNATSVSISGPQ